MTKNPPGYPLPSGELGEDEIVCQLVYLPNRDEYWQALLAAVHYFSTWRAWERDDDHRGKDAAGNWRDAFELTMECWRMTCLEEITERMDEIIDLIGMKKDCCDDNITYAPQEEITTDIEPSVGDPPEFYGETEVEDWEEWLEHVCYHAHRYVDALKQTASDMDTITETAAYTIGFIGAALVILTFVGLPLAIAYALAAATAGGLIAAVTEGIFANTEADIEAGRDGIVCALIQGTGLADAVEDALSSGLDWDLFFSQVPYDTATAVIYEGGHGGEYLETEKLDDCDFCGYQQLTNEDVWLQWLFAGGGGYDEEEDEWYVAPVSSGGCFRIGFRLWTDDTETVEKLCKIVVTSCTGTVKCGGNSMNIGLVEPTIVWQFDEPPFPGLDDQAIDRYVHLHEQPGTNYELRFKLYE